MWERLLLDHKLEFGCHHILDQELGRENNLKRPKLKIKIYEAANLPPMDLVNGLADAYVIIKLWAGSVLIRKR